MLRLAAVDRKHVLAVDPRGEVVLLKNDLVNHGCCLTEDGEALRCDGSCLVPVQGGVPPLTWMADGRPWKH